MHDFQNVKNLVSFQTSSGVFPFNQTSGTRLRMWAVVCTASPHRFLGRLVAANMLRAISIIRFCCSMLCSEHYDVEYLWIILFRRDIFWNASDINSFALSDCNLCILYSLDSIRVIISSVFWTISALLHIGQDYSAVIIYKKSINFEFNASNASNDNKVT